MREPDVRDWLELVREQNRIDLQMEIDYLFGNINVPPKELTAECKQPKGFVIGIIDAIKRGSPRQQGSADRGGENKSQRTSAV